MANDFDVDDAAQELERQPTTKSGSVRKKDAMAWLKRIDEPSDEALIAAVTHKPDGFSGSTFATPVSQVRVTGNATFIAAVAGLLKPMVAWESSATRLDLKVQQVEDRDTGEMTDNYALYLGATERGGQGKIASSLMGTNDENDRKLLEALDDL